MMMGSFVGGLSKGVTEGRTLGKDVVEQQRRKRIEAEVAKALKATPTQTEGEMSQAVGMEDQMLRGPSYNFMGTTQDSPFTPEQMRGLQRRKIADIYMQEGRQDDALKILDDLDANERANAQLGIQREQLGITRDNYKIARETADRATEAANAKKALTERLASVDTEQGLKRQAAGDVLRFAEDPDAKAYYATPEGRAGLRAWADAQLPQGGDEASRLRARADVYQQAGPDYEKDAGALRKEAETEDSKALAKTVELLRAGDTKGAMIAWNSSGEHTGQIPLELRKVKGKDGKETEMLTWIDLRTGQVGAAPTDELMMTLKERKEQELKERKLATEELYYDRAGRAAMTSANAKTATTTPGNGYKELAPEQYQLYMEDVAALPPGPDGRKLDPRRVIHIVNRRAAETGQPFSVAFSEYMLGLQARSGAKSTAGSAAPAPAASVEPPAAQERPKGKMSAAKHALNKDEWELVRGGGRGVTEYYRNRKTRETIPASEARFK